MSNAERAREALREIFSGDYSRLADYYAPDFADHVKRMEFRGIESIPVSTALPRSLCPDLSVEFDRRAIAWMQAGEGHRLAALSSSELIEHGEAELRQWIVLLGAIGSKKPEFLVYEPLFRSIMGMGVAWW